MTATLCKDTVEGARPRSNFLPTQPLIGSWAYKKRVNEQLPRAETCQRSPGGIALSLCQPAGEPSRGKMRSSCVLLTALVALAAYYVYIPLPGSVSDPWKLMLLDATFRGAQQVVRCSPALLLSSSSYAIFEGDTKFLRRVPRKRRFFPNALRLSLCKVVQSGIFRVSHSPSC